MDAFPEDWEVVPLRNAVDINPQPFHAKPDEFFYIDLESVKGGHLLERNLIGCEDAPSRAQRQFENGDILFQTVRPYQKNNLLVDFDARQYIASTGYAILHPKSDVSDGRYVYASVLRDQFVADVLDNCTGTSYPAINPKKLGEIHLLLPPLPEQRRIAAALGDMDKLIGNLLKRIEKKKAIKQGAVEELLTGKKRLSGFGGEWVEYRLGELVDVFDGTHQTPNYVEVGIPFYSVENITSGDFVHVKQISISEHRLLTKVSKIERGDVLMTRIGSIGVCKYIDWEVDASFYVSLALLKSKNKSIFDMMFLVQLSHYSGFKKEILSHSLEFATPMKINKGEIAKVRIKIPPTFAEQRAIAKVLGEMDAEIAKLEVKREKLVGIKKGMMSDLLTGKVRLNYKVKQNTLQNEKSAKVAKRMI